MLFGQANRLSNLSQFLSISVTLVTGIVLIYLAILLGGGNPGAAATALVSGSLSGSYSQAETLIRACPLLLAGLGLAVAFRAGVWNIGAEGQIYMGALAVTALASQLGSLPALFAVPLAFFVAFISGGFWAFIAAFLRTRRGVQEVISTIMLNFLAIQIVSAAVHGPLREPTGQFPYSDTIGTSLILARLVPPTRFHTGVILAMVIALVVWVMLFRTLWGFKVRTVGNSPEAATHSGISIERTIWGAMFVSGGLSGLAGAIELMGVTHILFENFSPGYGYTAIAVALLGGLHPVGIVASGLLFGALQAGASAMQRDAGISEVIVLVVQGIIIFSVALQTARALRKKAALKARAEAEV